MTPLPLTWHVYKVPNKDLYLSVMALSPRGQDNAALLADKLPGNKTRLLEREDQLRALMIMNETPVSCFSSHKRQLQYSQIKELTKDRTRKGEKCCKGCCSHFRFPPPIFWFVTLSIDDLRLHHYVLTWPCLISSWIPTNRRDSTSATLLCVYF